MAHDQELYACKQCGDATNNLREVGDETLCPPCIDNKLGPGAFEGRDMHTEVDWIVSYYSRKEGRLSALATRDPVLAALIGSLVDAGAALQAYVEAKFWKGK